jgi:hypothetical protein
LLADGIYSFVKRGKFIRDEVSRDEGPAVLAAREFSALLSNLCFHIERTFERKKGFIDQSPYKEQIFSSCRKLKDILKEVNGRVVVKWQSTASISLLEILFTDEGFNRAGGDKGLAKLCRDEQTFLETAINAFHEELVQLNQLIPDVCEVLKDFRYDITKFPIE